MRLLHNIENSVVARGPTIVSPVSSAKPKNPQRYAAGFVLGFKDCRIIKESHPDVNKDY
jgi:hypothetical protein